MKQSVKVLTLFFAIISVASCQWTKKELVFPKTNLSEAPLIPKPLKTIATHSAFGLAENTIIYTSQVDPKFEQVGHFLAEKIKSKTGLGISVNASNGKNSTERFIYINKSDSVELKTSESYQLYIKKDSIFLNAKTAAGAFRGIQTLRQLIPEKSNDTITDYPLWLIPTGKIFDEPKFEYRGTMLDVSRHFFSVDEVKKYLDIIAYYKFNVLHLHLSDDQGWRIEIKSWPKLTEVGGKTEVGGGVGGYYTQEDFKELVAYAAERHITIVPEIDMPGHTNAASVSYPFLNGNGKVVKPYTGTRVGFSTFDAQKDPVYAFLDDVIREIASISPGPYFHIGGDESHVTKKKDYIHFVEKVEKIVQKHGKQMVGWDEIVAAKISPTSIAQHWHTTKNALKGSANGNKIILSPAKKAYLDMKYDSLSKHGLNWSGCIPVDVAYNWNPETYVQGLPKETILGIEAPLWSETISNSAELEYLAFPRAIGYAELGWSTSENCDWEDYRNRLAKQVPFLNRMNINYYPSELIDWE
ncbi:family 20 glycosylhydrolase [Flagellimonas eckloniae]|uniref:beta-N-acetylhexosaminidase n=1 Tax=Flagellimonas eckloniae TaxID=346185 RepID=A0A0Q1CCX5_9FLAO|nr:family 20 glycosylhydrolase [Allomuricauda eckloniae]KQC28509.1 beta-N-acetylhexosaminidase [Allomuricauda eckloniae]